MFVIIYRKKIPITNQRQTRTSTNLLEVEEMSVLCKETVAMRWRLEAGYSAFTADFSALYRPSQPFGPITQRAPYPQREGARCVTKPKETM